MYRLGGDAFFSWVLDLFGIQSHHYIAYPALGTCQKSIDKKGKESREKTPEGGVADVFLL